jgi:hypothetical protein
MTTLAAIPVGLIFVAVGVYVTKRGFTERKRSNVMDETPTENVGSVSMGQSEVEGTARPAEEGTIEGPLSDEQCLVAVWDVSEFQRDDKGRGKWRLQGNGVDYVPFHVDDGTGRALVRPSEEAVYEIDEHEEDPILVRDGDSPPDRVETFLEEYDWRGSDLTEEAWNHGGGWDTEGYDPGDRLYREHLLQPGEDAYVFGVAQPREDVRSADNAANVVFKKVPERDADLEDMFVIADQKESEIVDSGATQTFVAGIALVVVGFGIMLLSLL